MCQAVGRKSRTRTTNTHRFGFQTAWFRIPKGKKPGDMIEVKNPFIPKMIMKIIIPLGAKGKHFEHPVPTKLHTDEHQLCVVCCRDLEGNSTDAVPLRTCSMVACQSCFQQINGGSCPVCEAPLPSLDTMGCLPLLLVFGNESIVDLKDVILAEYFWHMDIINESEDEADARAALQEIAPQIEDEVKRLYRRKSRDVHPDRHPELIEEWEFLNKAKVILCDKECRGEYVSTMIEYICGFQEPNVDAVFLRHEQWMADYEEKYSGEGFRPGQRRPRAGRNERKSDARQQSGHGATPVKAIEDGTRLLKLKKPIVNVLENQIATDGNDVLVYLNKKKIENYVKEISFYGSCGALEEDQILLHNVQKADFDVVGDEEIQFRVRLPCNGVWTFTWDAEISYMDDGSTSFRAPLSSETVVDVGEGKARELANQVVAELVSTARHRTNSLRSATKCLSPSTDRHQIEDRYYNLQNCLVKSMKMEKKLSLYLDQNDNAKAVSDALTSLAEVISLAKERGKDFEKRVATYPKRDEHLALRETLLGRLKTDDVEHVMKTITKDDLDRLGTDANVLFQILNGQTKPSQHLKLSSKLLYITWNRTDLFSAKQRKRLKARADTIAAEEVQELRSAAQKSVSDPIGSGGTQTSVGKQLMSSRETEMKADPIGTTETQTNDHQSERNELPSSEKTETKADTIGKKGTQTENRPPAVNQKILPSSQSTKDQPDIRDIISPPGDPSGAANVEEASQSLYDRLSQSLTSPIPGLASTSSSSSNLDVSPYDDHGPFWWNRAPRVPSVSPSPTGTEANSVFDLLFPNQEDSGAFRDVTGTSGLTGLNQNRLRAMPLSTYMEETAGAEESSNVSALTVDAAVSAIGGEEIAFHATNRFVPIVSPLSELNAPRPSSSSSSSSSSSVDPLLVFLKDQKACLKCDPETFHQWLLSQDIKTVQVLADAMEEDDFVTEDMREAGLTMYKRKAFVKAIHSAATK